MADSYGTLWLNGRHILQERLDHKHLQMTTDDNEWAMDKPKTTQYNFYTQRIGNQSNHRL